MTYVNYKPLWPLKVRPPFEYPEDDDAESLAVARAVAREVLQ